MPEYTIRTEQQPEDPAYVQAMINKAEGVAQDPQGEQLIAGKYKTEEELHKGLLELIKKQSGGDLAAYYKKLESDIGRQQNLSVETKVQEGESKPQQNDQKQPEPSQQPSPDQAMDFLTTAGVNVSAMTEEFQRDGALSDASYKELWEKAKLPREVVDTWIAGQQAIAAQFTEKVYDIVGGAERYDALIEWARNGNISPEEARLYDEAVASFNMPMIKLTLNGLQSRFEKAHGGREPKLLEGQTGATGLYGFQSKAELVSAMSDPRYQKDPAYRDMVIRRLARSTEI